MEFIMQVCGAMLAVAGCLIVLSIAAIAFYAVAVGIRSAIEESKKSRPIKRVKNERRRLKKGRA